MSGVLFNKALKVRASSFSMGVGIGKPQQYKFIQESDPEVIARCPEEDRACKWAYLHQSQVHAYVETYF